MRTDNGTDNTLDIKTLLVSSKKGAIMDNLPMKNGDSPLCPSKLLQNRGSTPLASRLSRKSTTGRGILCER
jgi:hypothetical protein